MILTDRQTDVIIRAFKEIENLPYEEKESYYLYLHNLQLGFVAYTSYRFNNITGVP